MWGQCCSNRYGRKRCYPHHCTTPTPPSYCLTTRSSSTDRPRTVTQSATIHMWPQALHPTHSMHSLLLTSTCPVLFHLIHLPVPFSSSSSTYLFPFPPRTPSPTLSSWLSTTNHSFLSPEGSALLDHMNWWFMNSTVQIRVIMGFTFPCRCTPCLRRFYFLV